MRHINKIIIHCSATPEGRNFSVADITRWHQARGWRTIGYHYVIYRDGTIHPGRPISEVGAHCKNYNAHSIGICYIGGTTATGQPKDTRTPEQTESLRRLVWELQQQFPDATVHGHREFAAKACPCFDVKTLLGLLCAVMMLASCRASKETTDLHELHDTLSVSTLSLHHSTHDSLLHSATLTLDSFTLLLPYPPSRISGPSEPAHAVLRGKGLKMDAERLRVASEGTMAQTTDTLRAFTSYAHRYVIKRDPPFWQKYLWRFLGLGLLVLAMVAALKRRAPIP